MSRKQLLIIAGFTVAVLIIGFAIYSVFFKPLIAPLAPEVAPPAVPPEGLPEAAPAPPRVPPEAVPPEERRLPLAPPLPPPPPNVPQEQVATDIASGNLVKTTEITQKPAYGVTMASDGKTLNLYDRENGKFYRVDDAGNLALLSDKQFFDVQEVNWAPNKTESILEYPDGSKTYYNFKTQSQVTLPKHWDEFEFSPNSQQIAFKSAGTNLEDNWLAIANPDGSEPEAIQPLAGNGGKVQASWSPNDQVIGFFENPIDFNRQEIYFLGKNNENFKLAVTEGRDFRPLWFPDGRQVAYSVYDSRDGFIPSLWMMDAIGDTIGDNRAKIEVNTWADRCAFNESGSSLYCSRPKEMPPMAGLFPNLVDNIPSEIIRVDTASGRITKIGEPENPMNITQIFVNDAEDAIYFQNGTDLKIQKMKIK
ncbi:MAG: hypothetical protein HY602_01475 [Parcubacteria group bacterium]|nr:hypothetical protein [Parcubacteria group bacterium]